MPVMNHQREEGVGCIHFTKPRRYTTTGSTDHRAVQLLPEMWSEKQRGTVLAGYTRGVYIWVALTPTNAAICSDAACD